jgi:hypothetical protein
MHSSNVLLEDIYINSTSKSKVRSGYASYDRWLICDSNLRVIQMEPTHFSQTISPSRGG